MKSIVCTWPDKDPAFLVPPLPCAIDDWDVIVACPWCGSFETEEEPESDPNVPIACGDCHRLYQVEPLGFEKKRIFGIRSETDLRFMSLNFLSEAIVNFVQFSESIKPR